ncbi:MAG: family 16 glycosylhydrolase [Paludibacteraceae bacterium]|nr:family 16 glycosylhydrolase [Paludibacteraceae bacterium]
MKKNYTTLLFLASLLFSVTANAEYKLVWSDEFDCNEINKTVWTHEIGTGQDGWGNWESEYYTDKKENSYIEDGNLVIRAIADETQYNPKYKTHFTSARMITRGKLQIQYGKVEARIKLPESKKGVWPAFWMLGQKVNWPYCGEIDIMEYMCRNNSNKRVLSTFHWNHGSSYSPADYGEGRDIENLNDFHIYTLEWNSAYLKCFVDGQHIVTMNINDEVKTFKAGEFFFILNLAIGGTYVGGDYDKSITEEKMYVDYVRVYQDPADGGSLTDKTSPCVPSDAEDVLADNSIDVWPNPASDIININSESVISEVYVIDYSNKVVATFDNISNKNASINISDLNNGMYVLMVQTNNGIVSKHIIKQ